MKYFYFFISLIVGATICQTSIAGSCYTVYNKQNELIFQSSRSPISLSDASISDSIRKIFPDGNMIISNNNGSCQEITPETLQKARDEELEFRRNREQANNENYQAAQRKAKKVEEAEAARIISENADYSLAELEEQLLEVKKKLMLTKNETSRRKSFERSIEISCLDCDYESTMKLHKLEMERIRLESKIAKTKLKINYDAKVNALTKSK